MDCGVVEAVAEPAVYAGLRLRCQSGKAVALLPLPLLIYNGFIGVLPRTRDFSKSFVSSSKMDKSLTSSKFSCDSDGCKVDQTVDSFSTPDYKCSDHYAHTRLGDRITGKFRGGIFTA